MNISWMAVLSSIDGHIWIIFSFDGFATYFMSSFSRPFVFMYVFIGLLWFVMWADIATQMTFKLNREKDFGLKYTFGHYFQSE